MRFRLVFSALFAMAPAVLTAQVTTTVAKVPAALPTATPTPRGAVATVHQPLASSIAPPAKPARLDFPALFNGEKKKLTVSITAPGSGYMTGALSDGNFHISEVRAIGDTTYSFGKGKGGADVRTVTSRTTSAPWQLSVAAGTLVEFDVTFEPVFSFENVAGPKHATLTLTGPGPPAGWRVAVPLSAMFNGIQLKPLLQADERELYVIEGDATRDISISLTGAGTAENGTIRGGTLPPGLRVTPVHAASPASGTAKVTVPLGLVWGSGGLRSDAQPRVVELVFDYPGGPQKTTFSLIPIPGFLQVNSFKRSDCGVAEFNFQFNVDAKGQGFLLMWGHNWDLINRRYVWGEARVAGRRFAGDVSIFYERKGDQVTTYARYGATPPDVMANIKRGQVTFACQLVKTLGPPELQPR